MKKAPTHSQSFSISDIHVPAETRDYQKNPMIFNVARLALSTPEGYLSHDPAGISSLHDRLKKVHIKPRLLVVLLILVCLVSVGLIYRATLATRIYALYTNIYDKMALEIKPLPPLTLGDIRISSSKLSGVEHTINNQPLAVTIGSTVLHPSSSQITGWYKVSPSFYGKTTLYVNKNTISSYLAQEVNKLKIAPVNQVTVSLADGYTTTLSSGSNGITFPSTSGISSQLSNNLLSGNGMNASLASITIPHTVTSQSSIPELLEVDVTAKRMYAYHDGSLVKTFLVTAGAPATPTPLGNFTIWDKVPEQTMTGYNTNGTKYVQPNVQWINYFDHNGDAVHGNYWRPLSYFGNVNSSHGCVGVVNSDAEWIYDWAPIGTPVVIHS